MRRAASGRRQQLSTVTRQITPAILRRALDEERHGEPMPPRSVLRQILAKMAQNGVTLTVVPRERTRR